MSKLLGNALKISGGKLPQMAAPLVARLIRNVPLGLIKRFYHG